MVRYFKWLLQITCVLAMMPIAAICVFALIRCHNGLVGRGDPFVWFWPLYGAYLVVSLAVLFASHWHPTLRVVGWMSATVALFGLLVPVYFHVTGVLVYFQRFRPGDLAEPTPLVRLIHLGVFVSLFIFSVLVMGGVVPVMRRSRAAAR